MTSTQCAMIVNAGRWVAAVLAIAPGCNGLPVDGALLSGGVEICSKVAGPDVQRQGAIQATDIPTDLALNGTGFFILEASRRSGARLFTREGRFTTDREGYLVNLASMRVLGYPVNEEGVIEESLGALRVGQVAMAPRATSSVFASANLQADAPLFAATFNPADPAQTSNFSISNVIYDSLGRAHWINVFFVKTATGTWDFHALADGGGITGSIPGFNVEIAFGTLVFDLLGRLVDVTQRSSFNPVDAIAPQELRFHFGESINAGGAGVSGVTQFASPSTLISIFQDGYPAGLLRELNVEPSGDVLGTFTNDQARTLGRVAVATFPAPVFLGIRGSHLFERTEESGEPSIGQACDGPHGCVVSRAMEMLVGSDGVCLPSDS